MIESEGGAMLDRGSGKVFLEEVRFKQIRIVKKRQPCENFREKQSRQWEQHMHTSGSEVRINLACVQGRERNPECLECSGRGEGKTQDWRTGQRSDHVVSVRLG